MKSAAAGDVEDTTREVKPRATPKDSQRARSPAHFSGEECERAPVTRGTAIISVPALIFL